MATAAASGGDQAVPAEPLTARGRRTRDRLLVAAREVFERDGYHDTRVTDIAKLAHVAHGTFYTYFQSKEDVFRHVVAVMTEDMQEVRPPAPEGATPQERIARANWSYYQAYRRNARMMGILEQVAADDEELRELRRQARVLANVRSSKAIARWQAEGLVDPELDARYAASVLGSMVDRSLYVWLVLEEPFEEAKALETLNLLCARALGLDGIPAVDGPRGGRRRKVAKGADPRLQRRELT
jgi:AcrR family transcriptional regulator